MRDYLELARLTNPVGTLLLLWPTLAALFVAAGGYPGVALLVIFSLGTLLMRSAGCVINDIADRKVDGHVARTQNRPLPTGAISTRNALIFFFALLAAAALLVLFLNSNTVLLAMAGAGVAVLYPFMKRWTYFPQVVLGAAFSWGILMAWTATDQWPDRTAGLLFTASLLWIVAYDTMYAMVDREDDLKVGIKSTAILFGELDRVMIGLLQAGTVWMLWLVGGLQEYQHGWYLGVLVFAGLSIFQQRLLKKRKPTECLAAFKNNVWAGFALFAGVVLETVAIPVAMSQ